MHVEFVGGPLGGTTQQLATAELRPTRQTRWPQAPVPVTASQSDQVITVSYARYKAVRWRNTSMWSGWLVYTYDHRMSAPNPAPIVCLEELPTATPR